MQIIEKEIMKKEIIKEYKANDGKIFNNEEECRKYENTAYAVINAEFRTTILKIITEYDLLGYGMGSEDYEIAIINIKNHNDLDKVNRMIELTNEKYHSSYNLIGTERIGQTFAMSLGYSYEKEFSYIGHIYGTKEEILKDLEKGLNITFNTVNEKENENED